MAQYLTEELLDSKGEPVKKTHAAIKKCPCKSKKKVKHDINPADDTNDSNDSDFILGSLESDSLNPADDEPLTNAEVLWCRCVFPNCVAC